MFFFREDRRHVEFLKRIAAQLDEALKPRPPIDFQAEFARQQAERTTSLTTTYTGTNTCESF